MAETWLESPMVAEVGREPVFHRGQQVLVVKGGPAVGFEFVGELVPVTSALE